MKIHEYQAKDLLRGYGIPVPDGKSAASLDEAKRIAGEWKKYPAVIKAQVHAGGRGKAGGVRKVKDAKDFLTQAEDLLGSTLVTHQTGPGGVRVGRVLLEECISLEKEFYFSILVDRSSEKIALIASASGGMDIEEVAEKTPEKIVTLLVHPGIGPSAFHIRKLAKILGLDRAQSRQISGMVSGFLKAFMENDLTMLEINPLGIASDGKLYACDAKVNIDDNALYRHKNLEEMRDDSEEDAREVEAKASELSYIALDGNIGCMVNGAGLAMATMDLIKLYGGEPANFLDIGGGAKQDRVAKALEIILSDSKVKGILINIFGGIVRCDEVARGLLEGVKNIPGDVKIVIRLIGTNQDEGRKLLTDAGYEVANEMPDAARKIVEMLQ